MKGFLVAAAAAALLLPATANAARHDRWPLHPGSAGTRVDALQWLLAGHRPNKFTQVEATFHGKPNGFYGVRTRHALLAYKFRLGYPVKGQCRATHTFLAATVTPWFFRLLKGQVKRSACWVAVAAARVKAVRDGPTKLALRIRAVELGQLGHDENPLGSNCGPAVNGYFSYFGLGCGLQWCAIFQNWAFAHGGYTPVPFPSGNPWYVPTIAQWAADHNWLSAKPRVGSLVAFLNDQWLVSAYHIGFVVKVMAAGYVTVEGNSGVGGVHEIYRPNSGYHVFIDLPGVA